MSMYRKFDADDAEPTEVEETGAEVVPVGYHLETENSRSNLWLLDEGDGVFRHKQKEQEEVYHVLEGTVEFEVGDEDPDEFVVESGGFVSVSPEEPRSLEAVEESRVFIIGAPFAKDDGVVLD